jgi:hypothetical protein
VSSEPVRKCWLRINNQRVPALARTVRLTPHTRLYMATMKRSDLGWQARDRRSLSRLLHLARFARIPPSRWVVKIPLARCAVFATRVV